MELAEMMNQILMDACPGNVLETFEDGRTKKAIYIVEVHCVEFAITAEFDRNSQKFTILGYEAKDV